MPGLLSLSDQREARTLLAELERREAAQSNLLDFIRYTREGYDANWHHAEICKTLDSWIDGTGPERLMLFMPASNGKSEIVSRCLPAYLLGKQPVNVIACSHTQTLADEMSRDAREIMASEPYRALFSDVDASGSTDAWRTGNGGRYHCAGIGGPVTGKHFHFGIIDDPIKNAEEAFSEVMREKAWQWYTRVFRTRRIGGNARMLLTSTRWHEDDLAGRILDREVGRWHVISFPAIAEHDEPHRRAGDPLWPQRYPLSFLQEEKALNPYAFEALYQQRPVSEGGGMFKRQWFRYAERNGAPNLVKCGDKGWLNTFDATRYLTVDLASSEKTQADFTVIASWASFPNGYLVLLDVVRLRCEAPDIVPQIHGAMQKANAGDAWIEKIGFQSALLSHARLSGLPVRELRPDKDKVTRAAPAASLFANGRLWFAEGEWRTELERELLSFPAGKHDDQVDVVAYGAQVHNKILAFGQSFVQQR